MTKHCCESDCVGCETYAKIKEARKKALAKGQKAAPKENQDFWR